MAEATLPANRQNVRATVGAAFSLLLLLGAVITLLAVLETMGGSLRISELATDISPIGRWGALALLTGLGYLLSRGVCESLIRAEEDPEGAGWAAVSMMLLLVLLGFYIVFPFTWWILALVFVLVSTWAAITLLRVVGSGWILGGLGLALLAAVLVWLLTR